MKKKMEDMKKEYKRGLKYKLYQLEIDSHENNF